MGSSEARDVGADEREVDVDAAHVPAAVAVTRIDVVVHGRDAAPVERRSARVAVAEVVALVSRVDGGGHAADREPDLALCAKAGLRKRVRAIPDGANDTTDGRRGPAANERKRIDRLRKNHDRDVVAVLAGARVLRMP